MTDVVLVLTTIPAEADGEDLGRRLVEPGHAACVSVLPPMHSVYRWQGAIESSVERQVLIKTTADRVPALEAAVRAWHPYEVPEFLVLPVADGGAQYLAWVRGAGGLPASGR